MFAGSKKEGCAFASVS